SNGEEICIAEYFFRRYGITLQYPHWPLAIGSKKVNGIKPSYPVELLIVADYQRVGNENITSTDIATIVKSCAVVPAIKNLEINICYKSFSFGVDAFMKKAGMSVLEEPLKVLARVLKAPQVEYANGNIDPEQNGKWRLPKPAKYVIAASLKRWLAVFLIVPQERMKFDEFKQFAEKFYFECGNRGLRIDEPYGFRQVFYFECGNRGLHIDEPYGFRQVVCDEHSIEELFETARQEQCEFILFGHSDRDTTHHAVIKGMERKYSVITQCVRTKTIFNVNTKSPLSLENIVAKTNVKLGGNVVKPSEHAQSAAKSPERAESAAGSGSSDTSTFPANVSVLGFCANDGVAPNEFIGNFFFSPPHRDEKLSVLDKLLEEVLERFQANRQAPPSRIVLFRSGCDEGGYQSVLRYEKPVITAICKKYAPGAPVTVIIPSKLHSFRFFKQDINPRDRSDAQNIRPGTCLDEHVISSAYSEFYLNSHLAIQGTAKTPKYTILFSSEKEVKLDLFERWTNALCYDFQIVTSPTSIPAPVYIAQRYAERGRQIWNTFATSDKASLDESGSNGNGSNGHGSDGSGSNGSGPNPSLINHFFMKSLNYNFTKKKLLRGKRVNA
uniref:Piwi domain-containing protein n=1 Tax=Panagrolaimus sp. PS1159 TaxID=55785 RepID=A0AC35F2I4_9BILA